MCDAPDAWPVAARAAVIILRTLAATSQSNRREIIEIDVLHQLLRLSAPASAEMPTSEIATSAEGIAQAAASPGLQPPPPLSEEERMLRLRQQLEALHVVGLLCAQPDFKSAIEGEGSLFAFLFTLRDSPNAEVCRRADAIAVHWDEVSPPESPDGIEPEAPGPIPARSLPDPRTGLFRLVLALLPLMQGDH